MPKPIVLFLALFCLMQNIFAQELIPYSKGKLWGFVYTNGRVLVTACELAFVPVFVMLNVRISTEMPK